MRFVYIAVVVAVALTVRISMFRARRNRARQGRVQGALEGAGTLPKVGTRLHLSAGTARARDAIEGSLGDVGMIASREIRERVRGRIFRFGTLVVLVAVGAAIIIPSLHTSAGPTTQRVGIVGPFSPEVRQVIHTAGSREQDIVRVVMLGSVASAKAALRAGEIDFAVVGSGEVLLNQPATAGNSPADPGLVQDVADYLGVLRAYQTAGITPAQAAELGSAKPAPVIALEHSSKSSAKTTSVIGLVLLFFMLTQYCTWILIGVMQEKASRVVEVLLATVRPIQLLGGKVLGIGLVALGQAALVVGFALVVAEAVGSDLLKGTAPTALLTELLWLVLGYAFYSWVYAAAGSMAERQDQVQTLALPLSIPILLSYVFAITVASTGDPDVFFKVLAYLPPTAPFCMSVLVALGQATWWEFVTSVVISLAGTAGMAVFAAGIYRRAVLRTGSRVRVRELLVHTSH